MIVATEQCCPACGAMYVGDALSLCPTCEEKVLAVGRAKTEQRIASAVKEAADSGQPYVDVTPALIAVALKDLDGVHGTARNGHFYRACDRLRRAIGLGPMQIGGKPSEGLGPKC